MERSPWKDREGGHMQEARFYVGHYVLSFVSILYFTAFWHVHSPAFAESQQSPNINAEAWIHKQVQAGETANLKKQYPDRAKRVLSASFLKNLLTKPVEMQTGRPPVVRILHAVLLEPVDFEKAPVLYDLELIDCHFEDEVDFSESSFKTVSFKNSWFQAVDVHGATFGGSVTFDGVEIARQLDATKAQFTDPKGIVSFNKMKVGDGAKFEDAIFKGSSVNFQGVDITGLLFARHAQFIGTQFSDSEKSKIDVFFDWMKVKGDAHFEKAIFEGRVSFSDADVTGRFVADETRFTDPNLIPNFEKVKVGGSASFNRAVFQGSVTFREVNITRQFDLQLARFTNSKEPVSFEKMKVGDSVNFGQIKAPEESSGPYEAASFEGGVNFREVEITRHLDARSVQFKHPKQGVFFDRVKVQGNAQFNTALFQGPIYFTDADITGRFELSKAEFRDTEQGVSFEGMKVGDSAIFDGAIFAGQVTMMTAVFRDVLIRNHDRKENSSSIPFFNLSRTLIRREFRIENASLQKMNATFLQVEGPTFFKGLSIKDEANFEHSTFSTFTLCNTKVLPKAEKSLKFDGMNYQRINAQKGEECAGPWEAPPDLPKKVAYSSSVYTNLEAFFRRQGRPQVAEDVFRTQKQQERDEIQRGTVWVLYWLWWLVGYGHNLLHPIIGSAIFVGIGCLVFRKEIYKRDGTKIEGMIPIQPDKLSPTYNALWYSLDLFLPVIDLQTADAWMPAKDRWVATHYMRVHSILGSIWISIGLATLTGILR
jgi:uncharacterized protein YjbI with pentapeptide repeats